MAIRGGRRYQQVEEDESYFVSMTDMLVGLIFIFIILVVFFALITQQENQEIKKQREDLRKLKTVQIDLINAKKKVKDLEGEIEGLNNVVKQYQEGDRKETESREAVVQGVQDALDEAGVKGMLPLARLGVLRFAGENQFDSGKYEVVAGSDFENLLGLVADSLADQVDCYAYRDSSEIGLFEKAREKVLSNKKVYDKGSVDLPDQRKLVIYGEDCEIGENALIETIMIEGHTDTDPYGTGAKNKFLKDNLDLSAQRALSVYRFIMDREPILGKYYNPQGDPIVNFSGYGESRPVSKIKDKNRRIDLRFIMDSPEINIQDPGLQGGSL